MNNEEVLEKLYEECLEEGMGKSEALRETFKRFWERSI